ncbi:MAG: YciI family protein [Casimicrobiaceae bacterium]
MTTTTKCTLIALLASVLLLPDFGLRAEPAGKRPQFIYVLRVTPGFHESRNWTDRESAVIARHFERLAKAAETGQVILAGRTDEALAETFGVVIFEAEDAEAARRFMETDPSVVSGLMSATLHLYAVALQRKR